MDGLTPVRKAIDKWQKDESNRSVLSLQGTAVSEGDAADIAGVLKKNKLQMIQLGACSLSDESLKIITKSLYTGLSCKTIARIDLSTSDAPPVGNALGREGSEGLARLIEKCHNLHHLKLADCNIDCHNLTIIAKGLRKTTSLKTLDLSYNHVDDEGARELGGVLEINHSLQGLSLWKNQVTSEGMKHLAKGLGCNDTLQWLGLGCNSISDDGIITLTDALIDNISECKLSWLALGDNKITDRGIEKLAEFLTAGWTSIDEDEGENEVACPLTSLGLGGNEIGDEGAKELAQALDVNDKLLSLGLSFNKIGNEGAVGLANMLRSNTTLEKLALSGNQITNEGGGTLIASLCQNNTLSTLILSQNPLDDSIVHTTCIDVFTRYNFTLQDLDLSDTNINQSTLNEFVERLKETQGNIHLHSLGDQILTINEKETAATRLMGNLLESATGWRPPPASIVPNRGLFDVSDRTRGSLNLPTMAVPDHREHDEDDDDGNVSSDSSLDLDMPMFSGNLVDKGEGEGIIATNYREPLMVQTEPKEDNKPLLQKRRSIIVEQSIEMIPLDMEDDMSSIEDEDNEITLIDDEDDEVVEEVDNSHVEENETTITNTSSVTIEVIVVDTDEIKEEMNDETHPNELPHSEDTNYEPPDKDTPTIEDNREGDIQDIMGEEREMHDETVTEQRLYDLPPPETDEHHYYTPPTEHKYYSPPLMDNDDDEYDDTVSPSHEQATNEEPLYDEIPRKYQEKTTIKESIKEEEEKTKETSTAQPQNDTAQPQLQNDTQLQDNAPLQEDTQLQSIDRGPLLYTATKERPKPPPVRRRPTLSHSPSVTAAEKDPIYMNVGVGLKLSKSENEAFTQSRVLSLTPNPIDPEDNRPLKEQWETGLKKRTAVLKMGGFIHTGYDSITEHAKTITYNNFMAELACNEKKNRKNGPLAPSHTRVKLQRVMEDLGSDYINANFMGSPSFPKSYIIAQWPTEDTNPTFWRMIWEVNARVIVVLGDGEGEKEFWPSKDNHQLHPAVIGGEWTDDSIFVRTDKVTPTSVEGLMSVSMVIHSYDDNVTELVTLFHYPSWAFNGVPQSPYHIAYMFHKSLTARASSRSSGPLVIVSAYGGSRAGCYCTVSVAFELMNVSGIPNPFDEDPNILSSVFKGLLGQRPGLVSSQRQYDFCHRILDECLWGTASQPEEETDTKGKGGGKLFNIFKKKKK
jgi:protein tyrosine phosphatase/Ran GTPase-activating protein (RanGAP) involved in mRNA processing and transport